MTINAMRTSAETWKGLRALQLLLPAWAVVSVLVALLPAGVGGLVRVVNAVLFLTMGPGCALAGLLARRLPAAVVLVVGLSASFTVLLLSSQLLLILGVWRAWRVAALVGAATIALVVVWIRMSAEVRP